MVDEIEALGTARANESVEIRPRVASLVDRIAFEEGQAVQQGALLLETVHAGFPVAKAQLLVDGAPDSRMDHLALAITDTRKRT